MPDTKDIKGLWKNFKKAFLNNAFLVFIFTTLWPIGFFIYNEIIIGQMEYISSPLRVIAYFGPMVTLPFIGFLIENRHRRSEELIVTTRRISELLRNVVRFRKLGIRYENHYLVPCWKVNKCDKKDCKAYKSSNLRCWQIAGTYCNNGKITGKMADKIDDCKLCPVYQTSTHNELTTIGEDFNNMMVLLEDMVAQQYEDFINTVDALGKLIEIKDPYTGGKHCRAVRDYAISIAKHLNLSPEQIENVKIAASLHDIGKIGIKGSILNKDGPLDKMEQEEIKKHPLIGEEAIKSIQKLKDVRRIVRYHHERYDGKQDGIYGSYTGEVKGDDIPIEARIITLADSYDAMTSDRPYRKAMTKEEALRIIEKECGKQFDPKIIEAFLKFIQEKES